MVCPESGPTNSEEKKKQTWNFDIAQFFCGPRDKLNFVDKMIIVPA